MAISLVFTRRRQRDRQAVRLLGEDDLFGCRDGCVCVFAFDLVTFSLNVLALVSIKGNLGQMMKK